MASKALLRKKIREVQKDIDQLNNRLELLESNPDEALRGTFKEWVEKAKEAGRLGLDEADLNDDGTIDIDELAEAVVDYIDEKVDLGLYEPIMDVAVKIIAAVAVEVYKGTDDRVRRRLKRRKVRLASLEVRLENA